MSLKEEFIEVDHKDVKEVKDNILLSHCELKYLIKRLEERITDLEKKQLQEVR